MAEAISGSPSVSGVTGVDVVTGGLVVGVDGADDGGVDGADVDGVPVGSAWPPPED